MTDLVPLLETSSDETELQVLRSLASEEPSAAAMARTAAALGLGAGALTVAGNATAASAVAGVAKSSIWGPIVKALAIGLGSGLVVSAGAHGVFSEPAEKVDSAPVTATPAAAPQPVSQGGKAEKFAEPVEPAPAPTHAFEEPKATPATETSRAAVREPQPSHEQPSPIYPAPGARATFAPLEAPAPERAAASPATPQNAASAPRNVPQTARATPAVSIAEETRAVDHARQALAGGRAREALNQLERYQVQWPRGVFTSEVLVLRVETKLKLGDRASAVREARALIAARPNSRYAARLRALIETSK